MTKIPFKSETLHRFSNEDGTKKIYRYKVFGGWIVYNEVLACIANSVLSITSTFVPDPHHEWEIE